MIVGAAITSVLGFVGVQGAAATAISAFLGRTIISAGLSLLARLVQGKPKEQLQPGIRTGFSTTGGLAAQSFIIGSFATAGHRVCPRYCHGQDGNTPNAYATLIIELSDLPMQSAISNWQHMRVIVGDDYSQVGLIPHAEYGFPLLGQRVDGTDHAWVKFHDGTQTTADSMLVEKYGDHPLRPWGADHIGTGIAYAVVTLRLNREVFQSEPKISFETKGISLYDPRKDTSVGGDGAHRWDDPATWEFTANPQVIKYNILRGISLPCGAVWGGRAQARDLPLSNWFAAMNVCDQLPDGYDGESEQRDATYTCGYEILLSDEPGKIIEELDKVCFGQSVEMGGEFRTSSGAPAAPVLAFTDDDISISDARDYEPFPGLENTHNGVIATYSEPESLWKGREAPSLFDAGLEVADGNRRLPVSLSFPACFNSAQAQQLMAAYAADHRRFRTHHIVLPPEARGVKVLNTVSWTSERYGYVNKLFEVAGLAVDPNSLFHSLTLRERDPSDTDWTKASELPAPANMRGVSAPVAQGVAAWAVAAGAVLAADDAPRRPALLLSWDGDQDDVSGLEWEVRHSGAEEVILRGSLHDFAAGEFTVVEGILASTSYEARARIVADRPREWSAWLGADTGAILLGAIDLDPAIPQSISNAAQSALADKEAAVAAAALAGEKADEATNQASSAAAWAGVAEASENTAVEHSGIAIGASGAAAISAADAVTAKNDAETASSLAVTTTEIAVRASLASKSTSGGNLAAHGNIDDPALWYSHYGNIPDPNDATVLPVEMWVADVDGEGTPGFLKDAAGSCWNYGTEGTVIHPDREYLFSVWLKREGLIATCRWLWKDPASGSYAYWTLPTVDDGEWRLHEWLVTGSTLLSGPTGQTVEPRILQSGLSLDHQAAASVGQISAKLFRFDDVTDINATAADAASAYISETNATASAVAADGSASASATSASEVAATLGSAIGLAGNWDFSKGLSGWVDNWNGSTSPTASAVPSADFSAGSALEFIGHNYIFWDYNTRMPIDRDKTYRVRIRIKATGSSSSRIYVGAATFNGAGAVETAAPGTFRYCAAANVQVPNDGEFHTYEGLITGEATTHNSFRPTTTHTTPMALLNYDQAAGVGNCIVDELSIEEVTDVENLSASISTVSSAQADFETGFSATYQIQLVAGSAAGTMGFYAMDDLTGDPVSGFVIDATYFTFKGDMALFDGAALQSSNYVLDTSGWRIDQAGNAQFNNLTVTGDMIQVTSVSEVSAVLGNFKTATTGERTEISDDGILIYDSAGDLVVAIGDLTGLV